jgi:antitoxin (DNA-binding transcriptional repressor) of toxin-antitoxin stability system
MFKTTVVASKLREDLAHYLEMVKKNEAVQIIHRGSPIRVLITQEHYLDLLSRLALYEKGSNEKVAPNFSVKELEERLLKKLKAADQNEAANDSSRVGRKRAK